MKKALVFLTVFCMLVTMLADTVAASSYSTKKPPLSMQILGKTVTPAPVLYKDKVFVSLRAIGQALGYQVNYGEKSKTMDLISKSHKVTVTVGYINAKVDGQVAKMELAPVLSNNSLYVPLSFVQKNFKYDVTYSSEKSLVSIAKQGTGSTSASTTPTAQKPAAAAAANGIYVMDKKINSTEKALVKSSTTFIPVRLVGESLGYKVTWSASTNTMTLAKQSQTIVMVSGKTNATINKKAVKLDAAPYLSGGKLYAPLSIVSKNMGMTTAYDSKKNIVSISEKKAAEPKPETPKPPVTQVPVNQPGIANIINIAYDESGGFPQINISSDAAIGAYSSTTMSEPNRLVIDIPAAAARTEFESKDIKQGGIARVRIGQLSNDPAIVRIVLDLDSQKPCKVVQSEDKKTISVLYANIITPISYQKEGDMDVIVVTGTAPLDTSFMELEGPKRVVLDVKRAVFDNLQQSFTASSALLKSIRIGQFDIGTARVVLDVNDNVYFDVKTSGNTSKIYLSSYPFEFLQYSRNYNTSVVNISPGKAVQYSSSVDPINNTVNLMLPIDLKLEEKRVQINDNLVQYIDYRTETINGSRVTTAAIKMQDSVDSEVISDPAAQLIKVRFKRKITSLSQLTIVVDAGHGGKDPGAVASDGTREKDLTLNVALKLEKHLKAMGFNTILTRRDDTFVELGGRTDMANQNYADFFMSVHFNAFSKTTYGIETLYYPNTTNVDYNISNKKIAEIFHSEVVKATGIGSRGITARPNLYVLNKTKMPAILAELGFVTNPNELALIKTEKYKEDAARSLAVSIVKYFRDIQGVNVEIDPNSIYAWPYEDAAALPAEAVEAQSIIVDNIEPNSSTIIVEETTAQPQN